MIEKRDLIAIRDYIEEDKNFITATWLRGLYYGNDWFGLIRKKVYFPTYQKIIESLLERPTTEIKVACLKDDPEVILGYSVYTGKTLHWVQVKSAWRNIKIATSLVPSDITSVSHITRTGKTLMIKKNLSFNPFI